MEENRKHVSDWLEKLQRESWNLELLVSGFSIFLLIQASQGLMSAIDFVNLHVSLSSSVEGLLRTLILILILASWILIFNLVVHVFLRGFWIGAVGLRSVQDKIDIDKLGYSEFFTEKLKRRVPSLDSMLERLDTLSSVIFSFTFLIVFMLLSMFLFFASISLFSYLFINIFEGLLARDSGLGKILFTFLRIFIFSWLILGILYFIDTISLGFFKKFKWTSKIFYPFYKWIGVITMAGVYRSIYYSLVSRFSKNKIRLALGVYLILLILLPCFKFDQYIFFPDNNDDFELSSNAYDDVREEDEFIKVASIPSMTIGEKFLPLFVRYRVRDNEGLEKFCTTFTPKKQDGFNSGITLRNGNLSVGSPFIAEENPGEALKCLNEFYSVKIDSIIVQPDFYFYKNPNRGERGIYTLINIDTLPVGKHDIFIHKKRLNKEQKFYEIEHAKIPFWKE